MAREYTPEELGIQYPAEKEYTPAELGLAPAAQKEYTPEDLGLVPQKQVEAKTSNPFKGLVARGAQLAGEGIEGIARAAETLGDKLETAMPLTNLTPEQVQNENQLQALFNLSKDVKDWGKDVGYAPSTQLNELTSNPLKTVPFVAERIISSSPDMIAAMGVAPAYIVSRTNEILNDRLGNDEKRWQEATVGDVSAATGAAILETFLERFATKHLMPGAGAEAKTVAGRVAKEFGIQSSTEAAEEGIGYLGGAAGTKKGVDPEQMALQMIEGAIVGGGLGAGVQGGKEYIGAKAKAREERAAEVPAERNAFSEATNYENTGNVAGSSKPGVSVPGEQGATERGTEGTTTGGMGGAELPAGRTAVREEELDNQLIELRNEQGKIAAFDPNDPRIGDLEETIKELQLERSELKTETALTPGERVERLRAQAAELNKDVTNPDSGLEGAALQQRAAQVRALLAEAKRIEEEALAGKEATPKIEVVGARKPIPPEQAGFDFNAPQKGEVGPHEYRGNIPAEAEQHYVNLMKNGKKPAAFVPFADVQAGALEKAAKENGWPHGVFNVPGFGLSFVVGTSQENFNRLDKALDEVVAKGETQQTSEEFGRALGYSEEDIKAWHEYQSKWESPLYEYKEEVTVPAKDEGFALDKGEKLAQMAAPEPIQEQETARMGLVGDTANPMGSISAFFNSIKPATDNPIQVEQYTAKVKNLVNDIAEFLGGKSTEQVSRYKEEGAPEPIPAKGADVSVPLEPGPELDKRMAVMNNFLDGLSLAPKEREAITTELVKQLPGMDVNSQTEAFQSLLRIPDINTVRGIDKLRAKFEEAIARYDRARTGQDEAALPYSARDTVRSTDPLVERRINDVLKKLEGIAKDDLTPEDKAALTYFRAWPYITAMRSAAFDLAIPFSKDFAGAAYKGQTNASAQLFQKWVEENLPQQEFKRFDATVSEYKREIARADQAIDNMKKRKDAGPIGAIYEKMLGRAPSGKVPGVFDAGLDKSPSEVKNLDPKDFYPMHPAVVEKIQQGDLKGALSLMARTPSPQASNKVKFQAKLAQRLLDLNLTTELLVDKQEELATRLIKESNAQRRMVLQHFQSYEWGADFLKKYGLDKAPTNEQTIREQFKSLQEIAVNQSGISQEDFAPILGQFNKLMDSYKNAVVTLDSAGVYIDAWNTISLNSKANGFSNLVFLHEVAHAGTYYSLAEENYDSLDAHQKKAVDELKSLYAHATEQFDKHVVKGLEDNKYVVVNGQKFLYDEINYGFNNIQEFVAEAYSNWVFQDYLKMMKYRSSNVGTWNKFVQSVMKLFKLDNVLGFTLANAEAIMRPTPLFQGQSAYAAVAPAKVRSILSGTLPANPNFLRSSIEKPYQGKPEWNMVKGTIGNFLSSVNDAARQHYLGAFTLRQLDEIIGHRIPQVRKFISGVERMLDYRNEQLESARDILNPWMEYQNKNPEEGEKLNSLMIDATLLGEDPSVKPTKNKAINDTWNNLTEPAKKIYTQVRDFYKKQYESYVQMVVDNKKASLLGAGFSQADIDAHDKIKKLNITGIKELRANLQKKGLAETDIRTSISAGIKEALLKKGYTDQEIEAHNQLFAIEDHFDRHKVEPYFPIRRFGKFSAQFFTGKDKEFYTFESSFARDRFVRKYKKELKQRLRREIDVDTEMFLGNSIQDLSSRNMQDFEFLKNLKDMIQTTKGTDTKELRENLDEALDQLYYLTLPDKSVRKMFLNRKGVAGMDKDMLRAFAASSFHMAYQQSRFKFSRDLSNNLEAARKFAFAKGGEEGKVDKDYVKELTARHSLIMNPPDTGGITGFLSGASFVWYMTSPASAITNMLGVPAVGFPVISAKFGGIKTMAAMKDYGTKFVRSGVRDAEGNLNFFSLSNDEKTLTKLERDAYDKFVADGVLDVTLPHDIVGLAETPSTLYKARMQKVMGWVSFPFHVTERANREIVAMSAYKLAFDKNIASGYTEAAAQKKAIETSKDLTYKSMFDYSTLNKPRYFQHPALKVILQFKQFSQQMTYLLARSAYESIGKPYPPIQELIAKRNEAMNNRTKLDQKDQEMLNELLDIRQTILTDHRENKEGQPPLTEEQLNKATNDFIKEAKREARERLAGTLGMTAIFAGATGLPMWWMVSGIMNIMHAAFGDDDDEWEFNNWFKNWCADTFGGFVGDSISRGVVSQVLGANVADRLSLNDLWFRDARKSQDEVSAMQNFIFNTLGPTAGLAMSAADAVKQFNDGHIERAIETASPAVIKNFLKGARFMTEGRATTLRGNELVGDITTKEAITQMVGFTPERVAQRQKANIETMTANANILNRRQSLVDAHFMAWDNHDSEMRQRVIEKVRAFNRQYPEKKITLENLQDSAETRIKQRRLANRMGGAVIDPKLAHRLSSMGNYGKADE